jgi:hypothetical protein
MKQAEFEQHVGAENISRSVADALERAKALYAFMMQRGTLSSAWGARRSDIGDPQSR